MLAERGAPALPAQTARLGRPEWLLPALVCAGVAAAWSLALALSWQAPQADSAEQLVWAFGMEQGYWKHPPLPSWIMHGLIALFGPSVGLTFIAAQGSIALALFLSWHLGRAIMGPRASLVALGLTSLMTYHNLSGDSFNHNTALLPFQAATVLAAFRASRSGSPLTWALTGLVAALALLVKYVAIFPIAGLLLYFAMDRSVQHRRNILGLVIAALVGGCVLLPHALWLQASDFLPLRYARSVSTPLLPGWPAFDDIGSFMLMQLLRAAPLLLGAALLLHGTPRATSAPVSAVRRDRLFLWTVGVAPLALTLAWCIGHQQSVQSRWGANGFLLSGWLLMDLMRPTITRERLQRLPWVVGGLQLSLCLGLALGKTQLAAAFGVRTAANFPGAHLAESARAAWSSATREPLRLVIADVWLGGNLAANSTRPLAVLIGGEMWKSPWLKPADLDHCGALVLIDQTTSLDDGGNAAHLRGYLDRADTRGDWKLAWAQARPFKAKENGDGRILWGVIAPKAPEQCRL